MALPSLDAIKYGVIGVGFCAAALGVIHPWPIGSFFSTLLVLLSCYSLFGLTSIVGGVKSELWVPSIVYPLLPLAVVYVVSYFGGDVSDSTTLSWSLVVLGSLAFCALGVGELYARGSGDDYPGYLFCALAWAGVAYSFIALFQYYGLLSNFSELINSGSGRLLGSWQQPNLTTSTIWMALISLVGFRREGVGKSGWAAILLFGSVLALAASRLNYPIILFVALLGVVALRDKDSRVVAFGRQILWVVPVLVLCFLVFPVISSGLENLLVDFGWMSARENIQLADRNIVDRPRIDEHLKILATISEWNIRQWIFGIGLGGYGLFSFEQSVISDTLGNGKAAWLHSHNLFSMMFVETGLLGIFTVLGILGSIVYRLWKSLDRVEVWPISMILGVVFVHSMVEYPLWYPWYLFVCMLFLVSVFPVHRISLSSRWLMPALGVFVLIVVSAIAANQVNLAKQVITVAGKESVDATDYRTLAVIGNDGLMGSYATLARYRRFGPDRHRLEQQLDEVREMEKWRPVDLVKARKVTLLLLLERQGEACKAARRTARRYPHSGPILAEKITRVGRIDMAVLNELMGCIEAGLEPWGETLSSMTQKNQERLINDAAGY